MVEWKKWPTVIQEKANIQLKSFNGASNALDSNTYVKKQSLKQSIVTPLRHPLLTNLHLTPAVKLATIMRYLHMFMQRRHRVCLEPSQCVRLGARLLG